MDATNNRSSPNPLAIPELVSRLIDYVDTPIVLLNCSCVNSLWSTTALRKLYRGSMNDMRYRTPDISSLDSLFVASRERFAQNMQGVKYLTIAADTAARERQEANGTGPISLAIPSELTTNDVSPLCELLLHHNLKFLTIGDVYCRLLRPHYSSGPGEMVPSGLSNLEALSIHRSNQPLEIKKLCEWLLHCDLKVFQMSEPWKSSSPPEAEAVHLLRSLWHHRNLEALALRVNCDKIRIGRICANLRREMGTACWPDLRALYLETIDKTCLEMLPDFKNLSIFEVRHSFNMPTTTFSEITRSLSRCPNLQAIEVECSTEFPLLLTIAQGCPLLRKLRVYSILAEQRMTTEQFSQLLTALPQIECLSLVVLRAIATSNLGDLANSCPRLRILDLANTELCVSLSSLAEVPPFPRLEAMDWDFIRFDEPETFTPLSTKQALADEWRRVFPRLRRVPDLERRRGLTAWNPIDPEVKKWLWKSLRYEPNPKTDLTYMWQTEFESKMFGWPIVPADAFRRLASHSSG